MCFQCLLRPADRAAVLASIARHLAADIRFFLDSRNPQAREWEVWTLEATREARGHPEFGQVERWNAAGWDAKASTVTYSTHYLVPDGQCFVARSEISVPGFDELAAAISGAGLRVVRWFGEPSGGPIRPGCPDFIPFGGLA